MTIDWTEFWKWRNAQPLTAKDINLRNMRYFQERRAERTNVWEPIWQSIHDFVMRLPRCAMCRQVIREKKK